MIKFISKITLLLFIIYLSNSFVTAQNISEIIEVDWKIKDLAEIKDDVFDQALIHQQYIKFPQTNNLHYQLIDIDTPKNNELIINKISAIKTDTINLDLFSETDILKALSNEFTSINRRNKDVSQTFILPLKLENDKLIRLLSCQIEYSFSQLQSQQKVRAKNTENSVLSSGTWFKIGIVEDGVYKISYNDLVLKGIDVSSINPKNISLFGNGNGMLPEANSIERIDDLIENAIFVEGENDNIFNEDDYILFYGKDQTSWTYNQLSKCFTHSRNDYSDTTFYFLKIDNTEEGKRISANEANTVVTTEIISDFLDYICYEKNELTLYNLGRVWLSDKMINADPEKTIDFDIKNLQTAKEINSRVEVAGFSKLTKFYWSVEVNGESIGDSVSINRISGDHVAALTASQTATFHSNSESFPFKIKMHQTNTNSSLWIDYIELNFWRKLQYFGEPLRFRLSPQYFTNKSIQMKVGGCSQNLKLWDITDQLNVYSQPFSIQNSNCIFTIDAQSLKEYILFDLSSALSVSSFQKIDNQNLHSIKTADMLIISAPYCLDEAEEIANIHRNHDDLNTVVVNAEEVYNEFGGGTVDPTSIRDFVRMVYLRNNENLKYLLLLGDATFDYRSILGFKASYVSSYQSKESFKEIDTYTTDDYFGLMDDSEGTNVSGVVDIGIGRIPVSSKSQAQDVVAKISNYRFGTANVCGQWKNNMIFLADDDESNTHLNQGEQLATLTESLAKGINVKKVYIDAYPRISATGGYTFPKAHDALLNMLDEGALIVNYSGHGGVKGITDEKVFTVTDAMNLNNFNKLPFWYTGTCELGRFDEPNYTSLGEQLIINKNGGAFAMITTTRVTQASVTASFARKMYNNMFNVDAPFRPLGDIFRLTKSDGLSTYYSYALFGDPAMQIAYPSYTVNVTEANGFDYSTMSSERDIIVKAMGNIEIKGVIKKQDGLIDEDFNGFLIPKLFDKKSSYTTLGSADGSIVVDFEYFNDILFNGKVSVINGTFSFSCNLPYNINYDFGSAKLSFYAYDTLTYKEASGYFSNISIGGIDETIALDSQGPDIEMFWNTPSFEDGQIAAKDGVLYAEINDPQGIYHFGNNIGRDIIYIQDNNSSQSIILNEIFEPAIDDFTKGNISYPINELADGEHQMKIRVWDLHNNSSEKEIWFVVDNSSKLALSRVLNTPNPFSNGTKFTFEHNKTNTSFDVVIDIYNIQGQHIIRLETHTNSSQNTIEPIPWDGKDAYGNTIGSGTYIYRISAIDEDGNTSITSQRLVFIR